AADMVGAKRRLGALHNFSPFDVFVRHCERSKAISLRADGDCFVALCAPRNDRVSPRLLSRAPRPRASWPTAVLRSANCLPASTRSRIATTDSIDRVRRTLSLLRCGV